MVRLQSTISSVAVTEAAGVVQRWYGPRVEIGVAANYQQYYGILVSKNTSAEYKYSTVNSGLVERNVNDIFYDAVRQTYWVSYVTQGISEVNVDTKTWTDYTVVQGLPSNTVYAIVRASDGSASGTTLWAATQGGLAKLNSTATTWQGYGRSGGLPGDRYAWSIQLLSGSGLASSTVVRRDRSQAPRPATGLKKTRPPVSLFSGIPGPVSFRESRGILETGEGCECPSA